MMNTIALTQSIPNNNVMPAMSRADQEKKADNPNGNDGWQVSDNIFISKSSAKKVISTAAGVASAVMGAFVNSNAGSESGIINGAGMSSLTNESTLKGRLFKYVLSPALYATGAILTGGAGTAALYLGSTAMWYTQEDKLRDTVNTEVNKTVQKHLGKPEENPSTQKRILNGIMGGVMGFAKGGMIGGKEWYKDGQKYGEKLADKLFAKQT